MQINTSMTDALAKYMDLVSDEMKLTAGNVANIDTPGYHTMGLDFDAEFQNAIKAGGDAKLKPRAKEVGGLIERPDGNNVSLDREGLRMGEVQMKFRMAAALLKRELSTMSEAIHVDGK